MPPWVRRYLVLSFLPFIAACGTPQLHKAASEGDLARVAALLADRKSLEGCGACPGLGWHSTPLGCAAGAGSLEAMGALIARGADVNAVHCGVPPLATAASGNQVAAIRLLLDSGAQVDRRKNSAFNTALTYSGGVESARALLEAGADPDIRDTPYNRVPADLVVALGGDRATESFIREWASSHQARPPAPMDAQVEARRPPPRRTIAVAPSSDSSSDVDHFDGGSKKARPDDFALVVGVEQYQNIPNADYSGRDAATMKMYLEKLGVPEENIIILTGQRATLSGLANYLEDWLPRNVTHNSRVYFYYSGHGAPDPADGTAYLVPWDGNPSFLRTSAYPVARLYKNLGALKGKEIVVMLDSCFSGAGGRSVIAKGTRPLVNSVQGAMPMDSRVSLLTASGSDEITGTLDDQRHGLFTYYILKGLQGAADATHSGHVTLGELFSFVQKNVQRAARRQNREQTPMLHAPSAGLILY